MIDREFHGLAWKDILKWWIAAPVVILLTMVIGQAAEALWSFIKPWFN